ncbi:MAG: LysR family transcriptional regulator [Devosia sp.]|nr:LysR family transcriptional regulator [Devosia sp.]
MRQSYMPTISELQAFCACARLGATTRAALELNLTQSAVSRSLNTLEERLGVRLFNRVRQRLLLSDAGRALQRDADRLLDEINQAALTVMSFGGHSEVLRLAVLPTLASVWLIPRLQGFRAAVPQVTFDISARLDAVDFEAEPFDAAIQRASHRAPGAEADVLMQEQLVVVASPGLLGGAQRLDDDALARLPLLQQATRPSLWLDWFRHAGRDPRTILRGARFEHFDMVTSAAIAGLGVALLPEILVQHELRAGRLTLASDRRLRGQEPYALLFPARSEAISGFAGFRKWLLLEAQRSD